MQETLHTHTNNPIKNTQEIITLLEKEYPHHRTLLSFNNAFELLISVILSAQTTDEQVNRVTPQLFTQYPTPQDLAHANRNEVEKIIFTTGFYKNKTTHIIGAAKKLVEHHNSEIPNSMELLTTLPGVGRKTAGVVLFHIYNIPAIIVDTHFGRLCRRLEWTNHKDPKKVEIAIKTLLPETQWGLASMVVNFHGRNICKSKDPECTHCVLYKLCPNRDNASYIK